MRGFSKRQQKLIQNQAQVFGATILEFEIGKVVLTGYDGAVQKEIYGSSVKEICEGIKTFLIGWYDEDFWALDPEESKFFLEALSKPPRKIEMLEKLAKKHREESDS